MKTYRKQSFTLVELLVSIGLLSLMMMFMLRFFNSSQMLWKTVANESELRQNSQVALDLISDLVTTVQFTPGETTGARDRTMDSIFSLNNRNTSEYGDASQLFFACKTVSSLPKKTNDIRFIGLRLGDTGGANSEYTRGKLFLLVYADKRDEEKFYCLFPRYTNTPAQGNRNNALASLQSWLTLPAGESDENEYAMVIAENVVEFKIAAFDKSGTATEGSDISEPPCRFRIALKLLGKDDFATFVTLSAAARADFLKKNAITFTRDIFIGDHLALAKVRLPE